MTTISDTIEFTKTKTLVPVESSNLPKETPVIAYSPASTKSNVNGSFKTISRKSNHKDTNNASLNTQIVITSTLFIFSSYLISTSLVFCISWILLYTFNPDIVNVKICGEKYPRAGAYPDPVKCVIVSVFISIISILVMFILTRFS